MHGIELYRLLMPIKTAQILLTASVLFLSSGSQARNLRAGVSLLLHMLKTTKLTSLQPVFGRLSQHTFVISTEIYTKALSTVREKHWLQASFIYSVITQRSFCWHTASPSFPPWATIIPFLHSLPVISYFIPLGRGKCTDSVQWPALLCGAVTLRGIKPPQERF